MLLLCASDNAWSQAPRRPSAMQRATGIFHARYALERLDSVLAIRVLDARGAELAGVPVQWTLATTGQGATLRVVNATTDPLGVSRAEFTPGRSADAQRVIAEVRNVGRIEFAATVPAAAIRIVPAHMTLWSGDDTVVVAELRDARGTALAGGSVSWAVMDTTIIRVLSRASASMTLQGVGAGSSQLAAWVGDGKVRDTARATVRAVITGRFITADGAAVPAMHLEVSSDGSRDSIAVRDGRFSARFDFPVDEAVTLHATPSDTAYHDVAVCVDDERELQRLVIALVPKSFHIDAGTYTGQLVAIDARQAMTRVGATAPFWRLVPYSGNAPRKLLGWRESDLPLRIAFGRDRSNEPITVLDSVAFWSIAERMERDLGRALFVPADAATDTTEPFIRVEIRPQAAEGHTFVAWTQSGDASQGILLFRRAATLRSAHVVTHELVHLLGFGHSNGWPTVAQPSGGIQSGLTPQDVAYIQLAMKLRRLQEETGARPGLPVPAATRIPRGDGGQMSQRSSGRLPRTDPTDPMETATDSLMKAPFSQIRAVSVWSVHIRVRQPLAGNFNSEGGQRRRTATADSGMRELEYHFPDPPLPFHSLFPFPLYPLSRRATPTSPGAAWEGSE